MTTRVEIVTPAGCAGHHAGEHVRLLPVSTVLDEAATCAVRDDAVRPAGDQHTGVKDHATLAVEQDVMSPVIDLRLRSPHRQQRPSRLPSSS